MVKGAKHFVRHKRKVTRPAWISFDEDKAHGSLNKEDVRDAFFRNVGIYLQGYAMHSNKSSGSTKTQTDWPAKHLSAYQESVSSQASEPSIQTRERPRNLDSSYIKHQLALLHAF